MKLEGTTDTIPLRELIEMIAYSSVTGALNLSTDQSPAGQLYFRDGHLYHVACATRIGVDALAELFELNRAMFSFVSDIACDEESLWGDMDYHVRTAERIASRWQGIRPYISSLDLLPVLRVAPEVALRQLGPAYHLVLDRIDGQHTIGEIIADLGWAAIDIAEAMAQMSLDGLIDLRHAAQAATMPALSPTCGKLFERLLSRSGEPPRHLTGDPQRLAGEELVLQALRS